MHTKAADKRNKNNSGHSLTQWFQFKLQIIIISRLHRYSFPLNCKRGKLLIMIMAVGDFSSLFLQSIMFSLYHIYINSARSYYLYRTMCVRRSLQYREPLECFQTLYFCHIPLLCGLMLKDNNYIIFLSSLHSNPQKDSLEAVQTSRLSFQCTVSSESIGVFPNCVQSDNLFTGGVQSKI